MVRIRKGANSLEVPDSAYENFYKAAGWIQEVVPVPLPEGISPEEDVEVVYRSEEEEKKDEWEEAEAEVPKDDGVEKPLSEMSREELIEKAKSLGVEVGRMSNRQLREEIKKRR